MIFLIIFSRCIQRKNKSKISQFKRMKDATNEITIFICRFNLEYETCVLFICLFAGRIQLNQLIPDTKLLISLLYNNVIEFSAFL